MSTLTRTWSEEPIGAEEEQQIHYMLYIITLHVLLECIDYRAIPLKMVLAGPSQDRQNLYVDELSSFGAQT